MSDQFKYDDFLNDFYNKYKIRSAFYIKIVVIFLAIFIFYWSDLRSLGIEAIKNNFSSHILAIPFLLSYIIYRIRKIIITNAEFSNFYLNSNYYIENILGLIFCIFSYFLKWYGSYTLFPLEFHIFSMPFFIIGLILIIFNIHTLRALIFPILFLFLLIPPPITFLQNIGTILSINSSKFAYYLAKILSLPVDFNQSFGNPLIILTRPSGEKIDFIIDIACSGIYSLIGFIIFTIFISYISRGSIIKKITVLILGVPLMYSLNIFRIIIIILIGYFYGANLALNIFHLLGGWTIIFLGTILLLYLSEKILKINIFNKSIQNCQHKSYNNNLKYCLNCGKILEGPFIKINKYDSLKLILILLSIIPLTLFQVPIFTFTENAPLVLSSGDYVINNMFPKINDYDLSSSYRDIEFATIAGQDVSIMYEFISTDGNKPTFWIGLEVGPTMNCLHPWEICLIDYPKELGGPQNYEKIELKEISLFENPPIKGTYFVFLDKRSNIYQSVLYWRWSASFQTDEGFKEKYWKISLIERDRDINNLSSAKERLLPIALTLINYWNPISEWSGVTLHIAKNGEILNAILSLFIIITFLYYEYTKRQIRRVAKYIYNNISNTTDKSILEYVKKINDDFINNKISVNIEEYLNYLIEINKFHDSLENAEKIGLVSKSIVNIEDEPYLVWKIIF